MEQHVRGVMEEYQNCTNPKGWKFALFLGGADSEGLREMTRYPVPQSRPLSLPQARERLGGQANRAG